MDPGPTMFVLRIESVEPLAGSIALQGEERVTPFSGWIELMAAIARERHQATGPAPGELKNHPNR